MGVIEISWFPDAKRDFEKLDGTQRLQVAKAIKKIEQDGMSIGKALSAQLSGLKEIKMKRLGLRVIFREARGQVEVIEIVVIGKRSDKEVFKTALERLGD